MFNTILQYCKREKLIENGDYVLAGVSGGADSVCLLKLLVRLQKEIGFFLEVVHIEHGIRGIESENDAAFVIRLCEQLEVPMQLFFVDAPAYAKQQKLGLEEAARILRYDAYAQAAERTASMRVKVALAHHADDNAETVLFQLIRGSGIDGMSGMRPKRELMTGVQIVRPLLLVTRAEIEAYLEKEGQEYRFDATNTDTAYSRNHIRCEIMPRLCAVNEQAVSHINQSAALLRELGDYLSVQVEAEAKKVLSKTETGLFIDGEKWEGLPEIIKKEVLHFALKQAAGSGKDIRFEHITLLAGLFALQTGKKISLPYDLCAKRVYEGVLLEQNKEETQTEPSFFMELSEQQLEENLQKGEVSVKVLEGEIRFCLLPYHGKNEEISKNTYTKCFDYDKIKGSLQIRTRQPGDYLIVDEEGHKKRLKQYFINEKIPSDQRNKMLLLTKENQVCWVIGGRMSADVKVSESTKWILKVRMIGGTYED